jgi:hypothetical protein
MSRSSPASRPSEMTSHPRTSVRVAISRSRQTDRWGARTHGLSGYRLGTCKAKRSYSPLACPNRARSSRTACRSSSVGIGIRAWMVVRIAL